MDLWHWFLHEECDCDVDAALTTDCFDELLANPVQVFKLRKVCL